ncbi:MAG TPA: GNAT family acetyltransferase, partial [Clostridiales bacterium]|nr:GNAT family acetyltransferase [Clostridiales bacterium]
GLEVIKTFDYNNNHYYELGYDMRKKTPGANLYK